MARARAVVLAFAAALAVHPGSARAVGTMASVQSPMSSRAHVYLALGDSVPFGWADALAGSSEPWRFVGYPQYLAFGYGLRLLDAACPSEASGSFLSADQPDDGCRAYRATHPLHVSYEGTQLAYALQVVHDQPRLALVTLQLGANDLQLLVKRCLGDPACIGSELPAALQATAAHVATIVGALRAAGFRGQVIVIDYYNPTADPVQDQLIGALDQALEAAAAAAGADFLDLRAPFARAAAKVGGDPCDTGLIAKVEGACEIHPSWSGHLFIAMLVARELDLRR